jgi:hypothetical protein
MSPKAEAAASIHEECESVTADPGPIEITTPPPNEKSGSANSTSDSIAEEEEWEYVTGLKLAIIIGAITLSAFIMLLDMSIVVTVSRFQKRKTVAQYING